MKKQILIFTTLCVYVFSCTNNQTTINDKEDAAQVKQVEDSLINLWNEAWNKNDTVAIASIFNEKSVMMSGNWVQKGVDSIMINWVNDQVHTVANLQTQKTTGSTVGNMAFYNGFWTLDVTNDKDSVTGNSKGNFSSVWEKQKDGNWKMILIHMGDTEK